MEEIQPREPEWPDECVNREEVRHRGRILIPDGSGKTGGCTVSRGWQLATPNSQPPTPKELVVPTSVLLGSWVLVVGSYFTSVVVGVPVAGAVGAAGVAGDAVVAAVVAGVLADAPRVCGACST
jgi:hypothetical protein